MRALARKKWVERARVMGIEADIFDPTHTPIT